MRGALVFSLVCLAALGGLLAAEHAGRPVARGVLKLAASSAFIAVALSLDAPHSAYGAWVLGALLLGWVGDACLLGRSAGAFRAGLGSFLLSHLCYAVAFGAGPQSGLALAAALVAAVAAGLLVHRWLWHRLAPADRLPVAAYMVSIFGMCATAIGLAAASGRWLPAIGAVAFAVSDLFVARDQFIIRRFENRAWGLPLYYGAQLLMAFSVAAPPR